MDIKGRQLDFIEDTHTYLVDGVQVDSVTQILKRLFPNKYSDISPEVLQKASERGTQIHSAIEAYCKGFDDYSNEVKDFKFLQKHYNFKVVESEIPIILDFGDKTYAGRIDLVLKMDDELSVADIKTTSSLDKDYLGYQLNLYRLGVMQSYGYDIKALYGIHLKDGKRKMVKIPVVDEEKLYQSMKDVL